MIRVFPRKTKWTPTDELAFVGNPPLFRPPAKHVVYISCVFTWDIPEAERLKRAWGDLYPIVEVGGPAYGTPANLFLAGNFLKKGATITSRGCIRNCSFCFVPKREGGIRELPIEPGWNVMDNNLLACSEGHVRAVFEMLRGQKTRAEFSGGLDSRLLQTWHIEEFKTLRVNQFFFACDDNLSIDRLEIVAGLMSDFPISKKRCYVLIGFDGESISDAEHRLERVYEMGFLPFAMLYRPPETHQWSVEWRKLHKKWCRPAAYRARKEGANV